MGARDADLSISASAWALFVTLRYRRRRRHYHRVGPLAAASLFWSLLWGIGMLVVAMLVGFNLPLAAVATLTIAFAGVSAIVVFRNHPDKPDPSYCNRCGYDIRGLAEPRCPECGGAIELLDPRDEDFSPRP